MIPADLPGRFILPQAEEARVAQQPGCGPFGESDLAYQLGRTHWTPCFGAGPGEKGEVARCSGVSAGVVAPGWRDRIRFRPCRRSAEPALSPAKGRNVHLERAQALA